MGGGLRLVARQCGRGMIGVGQGEGVVHPDQDRLDRAGLDQPADDAVRDAGDRGKFADQPLPLADAFQSLHSLRSLTQRRMARHHTIFDDRADVVERRRAGQRHPQHRRRWGQIIVRGPLDQPAQRSRDRRQVVDRDQVAQAVVADLIFTGKPVGFPNDASELPGSEGNAHDRTGLDGHAARHAVIERTQRRVHSEDAHAGHNRSMKPEHARGNRACSVFRGSSSLAVDGPRC